MTAKQVVDFFERNFPTHSMIVTANQLIRETDKEIDRLTKKKEWLNTEVDRLYGEIK